MKIPARGDLRIATKSASADYLPDAASQIPHHHSQNHACRQSAAADDPRCGGPGRVTALSADFSRRPPGTSLGSINAPPPYQPTRTIPQPTLSRGDPTRGLALDS